MPDMVIACNVGQPTRNVLKCLAEERRLVRVLNEPTLTAGSIMRRGSLRAVIYDRLTRSLGKEPDTATPRDIYDALSLGVREELSARWLATQRRVARARVKRLCYLSVEFLPGRSLLNALSSIDSELIDEARAAVASMGHDFDSVIALEVDPGLGNGGLGRLAACYLDSLATLQYPATGYGIRYDYGIFTQSIDTDGAQRESASTWLRLHNVWETPRSDARYIVRFGGRVLTTHDVGGAQRSRWVETQDILAVGFDHLVPGNRSPRSITCACGRGARCSRSTSRTSTPAITRRPSRTRSRRRTCRACCTRTTPRRRARSCASSSSTSS
jgi:starch phosphorylase